MPDGMLSTEQDLVTAIGLALAMIGSLIERPQPVERGEVARYLALLAETGSPERPGQRAILMRWAQLMEQARLVHLSTHQFYPDAQSGGSGNPNVTILTMRRSPLVNQDKRPRLRFLG